MSVDTHDSDNIYFNVSVKSNNDLPSTIATYDATRTRNVIDKADDYYLSVVRFQVPAFYVPLLIFQPSEADPTRGIYSITMERNAQIEQINLEYIEDTTSVVTDDDYYWVHSYVNLARMVTAALAEAFALFSGAANIPVGAVAPFVTFNPTTKRFSLWADFTYSQDPTVSANPINIYFNYYLWTLLNAFPHVDQRTTNTFSADGEDIQITIIDLENNISQSNDPSDTTLYYVMEQEYVTLYNWNPYKKLVMVTNLLPTQSEYINASGDGTLKILTDFIPFNDINDVRSTFQYFPSAQYRLIDLLSSEPIRNIGLQVYWQDINDQLWPIELPPYSEITVKLAFVRKSLYKNDYEEIEKTRKKKDRMINKMEGSGYGRKAMGVRMW